LPVIPESFRRKLGRDGRLAGATGPDHPDDCPASGERLIELGERLPLEGAPRIGSIEKIHGLVSLAKPKILQPRRDRRGEVIGAHFFLRLGFQVGESGREFVHQFLGVERLRIFLLQVLAEFFGKSHSSFIGMFSWYSPA
jgi:hypothetical protein